MDHCTKEKEIRELQTLVNTYGVIMKSMQETLEKTNVTISALHRFMIEQETIQELQKQQKAESREERKYKKAFLVSMLVAASSVGALVMMIIESA